jgi:hypothetical protein
MLQPAIQPTPTNAVPNAGLVVARPVQQQQQSSATRNLTANPVRQNSESEEAGADSEEARGQRIEGERAVFAQSAGGRSQGRGELLDILV